LKNSQYLLGTGTYREMEQKTRLSKLSFPSFCVRAVIFGGEVVIIFLIEQEVVKNAHS